MRRCRLPFESSTGASALSASMRDGVDGQHVGPVEEIGDAAKALGLALGAIGGAGAIKPHERGVGRGVDLGLDFERERPVRRLCDRELLRRGEKAATGQWLAVERQRSELEFLAVEHERRWRSLGVRPDRELGTHRRCGCIERNIERHGFDEPVGRTVIFQADGTRFFGAHHGK